MLSPGGCLTIHACRKRSGFLSKTRRTRSLPARSRLTRRIQAPDRQVARVGPLVAAFEEIVANQGFKLLPISGKHAARADFYAVDHGDPLDRMLAAQAEIDDLLLATNDRRFSDF